jgi:hypothetical protein
LIRIGSLREAVRDEAAIGQYLVNAERLREDAKAASSAQGRFLLGYEALHALALAFVTNRGARSGGEGHRSLVLQLAIGELTKDAKIRGAVQAMIQIHQARNNTTYDQPLPPISDKLAEATLKLLDAALTGAKDQIQLSANPISEAEEGLTGRG